MTSGPSTIRPSARLRDVVERMQKQRLTSLPVTTSDGRLVGLLLRDHAERALARVKKLTAEAVKGHGNGRSAYS
jgi:CBS domain-containing protein